MYLCIILYIYKYIFKVFQRKIPTRMKIEVVTCKSSTSTETQMKRVVSSIDHPPFRFVGVVLCLISLS